MTITRQTRSAPKNAAALRAVRSLRQRLHQPRIGTGPVAAAEPRRSCEKARRALLDDHPPNPQRPQERRSPSCRSQPAAAATWPVAVAEAAKSADGRIAFSNGCFRLALSFQNNKKTGFPHEPESQSAAQVRVSGNHLWRRLPA
ncbi:hypothetical protein DMX09_29580 [Pseudomonas protegens]|nr:hypothetical protein DMX09_29580 [Pseudomonas protegens]